MLEHLDGPAKEELIGKFEEKYLEVKARKQAANTLSARQPGSQNRKPGSRAAGQPGSWAVRQPGRVPSRQGSQAFRQAASRSARQPGGQAGGQAAGSQPGSQAARQPGMQAGSKQVYLNATDANAFFQFIPSAEKRAAVVDIISHHMILYYIIL